MEIYYILCRMDLKVISDSVSEKLIEYLPANLQTEEIEKVFLPMIREMCSAIFRSKEFDKLDQLVVNYDASIQRLAALAPGYCL